MLTSASVLRTIVLCSKTACLEDPYYVLIGTTVSYSQIYFAIYSKHSNVTHMYVCLRYTLIQGIMFYDLSGQVLSGREILLMGSVSPGGSQSGSR